MSEAKQTSLLDLLDDVPADARQVYEHSPTHHQNIPFGRLAREAAVRIRELEAQFEECSEVGKILKARAEAAETKLRAMTDLTDELRKLGDSQKARAEQLQREQDAAIARAEVAEAEVKQYKVICKRLQKRQGHSDVRYARRMTKALLAAKAQAEAAENALCEVDDSRVLWQEAAEANAAKLRVYARTLGAIAELPKKWRKYSFDSTDAVEFMDAGDCADELDAILNPEKGDE